MKKSAEILYDYAFQFVGLPYRWGGDDSVEGFDCSGFVQELLSVVEMDPPGDQTAQKLFEYFYEHGLAHSRQFGALAFYGKNPDSISHVAMMLNDSLVIEAGGGGSRTTSKEAAARDNAYVRVRHVNARKDLVAIILPKYSWI